jgi:hypothetical protein
MVITAALRFDERVDWSRAREVVLGSRRRMTRQLRVVGGRGETDWR